MNKIILPLLALPFWAFNQSYAPAAGQPGSTAMSKDSSAFIAWATDATIVRGPQQIDDLSLGLASHGEINFVLGQADNNTTNTVSLGDGGQITITFSRPIMDGPGHDFAVFENGVTDNFLELAFVEVSSDGERFVRFPSYSESPTETQIHTFGSVNPRHIHNIAGKYKMGFGTPFDLADLADSSNIDLNHITHVRIIDVVGNIDPLYASYDSQGRIINDPFPTPFATGGFDLNAVGVINQAPLSIEELTIDVVVYPNPSTESIYVKSNTHGSITLHDLNGRLLLSDSIIDQIQINLAHLQAGIYILNLTSSSGNQQVKIYKK